MTPPGKAVIIAQKFPFSMSLRVGRAARALGLRPVLIADINSPTLLATDDGIECHALRDWSSESLAGLVDRIAASGGLAGMLTCSGLFTGQGLLGAQVAEIAAERGLRHNPARAVWAAHNKYFMRRTLHAAGVDQVKFARVVDARSLEEACEHVGFPLILKPVVGLGSSFIYRCDDAKEARKSFAHFRAHAKTGYYSEMFEAHDVTFDGEPFTFDPKRELLAEQFVDGPEFSVECLCTQDGAVPLMVHDKVRVEESAFTVYETLLITPPVNFSAQQVKEFEAYAAAAVDALGLRNAFSHVELRLDGSGRPNVLEINPRLGGMRVIDSLADVRGVDYAQTMVRLAVGDDVMVPPAKAASRYYGMMAFYPRSSGTLTAIHGLAEAAALEGVRSIRRYYQPGDPVGGDFEEVFVVDAWFEGADPAEIYAIDERIRNTVSLEVAPAGGTAAPPRRRPAPKPKRRTR